MKNTSGEGQLSGNEFFMHSGFIQARATEYNVLILKNNIDFSVFREKALVFKNK